MAENKDLSLTNEQFDKTMQEFAKVIAGATQTIRVALERNAQATLAQTIEIIKALTPTTHNVNASAESIAKSVADTFGRLAK
jgi:chemotaxis regulatin CheY-phosphate phosphatase CheZ